MLVIGGLKLEFKVDSDSIWRIADKVLLVLHKKSKNPVEAYVVLRFLSIYFEVVYGVCVDPLALDRIRSFFKDGLDDMRNQGLFHSAF